MLGDLVQEVTPEGEIVYSWRSWDHLDPETDVICFLENREEWTHQNALNVTLFGAACRQVLFAGCASVRTATNPWKLEAAFAARKGHHRQGRNRHSENTPIRSCHFASPPSPCSAALVLDRRPAF